MAETTITPRLLGSGAFGRREALGEPPGGARGPGRRGDPFDGARTPGDGPRTIEAEAIPLDSARGHRPSFPRLSSAFVAQFIAQQISPPSTTEQRTRLETAIDAYRRAQSATEARRARPTATPATRIDDDA